MTNATPGEEGKLVKTGYFLTVEQRDWLRQLAFDRRVTASHIVRQILDNARAADLVTHGDRTDR
jgi:hypothetical protein